jgi:hypothetical protein
VVDLDVNFLLVSKEIYFEKKEGFKKGLRETSNGGDFRKGMRV